MIVRDPDSGTGSARLDEALAALPQSVEPSRDLWADIEAQLEDGRRGGRRSWAWQAAAAVLLVAASSLVTATLVRHEDSRGAGAPATATGPSARLQPAALLPGGAQDPDVVAAREQLYAMLRQRLGRMPPSAQQKLIANLAEMRHAADEINSALDRAPGDPLLEELLLSSYQNELAVLASVNQMTSMTGIGTSPDAMRMQL